MKKTSLVRIDRNVQRELRLQTLLRDCTQEELATQIISDWLKMQREIYSRKWAAVNCEQANYRN